MDQKNMSSESPKMGEMKEEIRKKTDDKN
jgi:hypothetical protein